MKECTKVDTEMAPETLNSVPTHARRGIHWLVIAHITVTTIAALWVWRYGRTLSSMSALFGLWLGQVTLLGIWCGLGTTGHWKRLVGGVLGVGVLFLWWGFVDGSWLRQTLVFPGMVTSFVATTLLIVRAFRIVTQANSSATTLTGGLQFSIRQLLLLTFMVACDVMLWKVLQRTDAAFWRLLTRIAGMLVLGGVVSVWLILATKRPVSFGIGLMAMSFCVSDPFGLSNMGTAYTPTCMGVIVVSLLVVRRCGYRLVRLPKKTPRRNGVEEITKPEIGNPDSQSSSLSP
jgi:hypothetical protein